MPPSSSDQNQTVMFYESGTYGNALGTANWLGLIQEHSLSETRNIIPVRYAGNASRNVGQFVNGQFTYNGTISLFPQDFRTLFFALGKCVDSGSPSPYLHTITEINSNGSSAEIPSQILPSISLEISQTANVAGSNFVRTVNGAVVDTWSLSWNEGEIATVDIGYIAKDTVFASGAKTAVTAGTVSPYRWRDILVALPSGTSNIITKTKGGTLTISNNLQAQNYAGAGSDAITEVIPTERDYELTLNVNADPVWTKGFYDQYFFGGSTFNMQIAAIVSAGSREGIITLSGCKLDPFDAPNTSTGVNTQSLTIKPQVVTAVTTDEIQYYHGFSVA